MQNIHIHHVDMQKKEYNNMKVYFIGAGPGAADLITLRGVEIIKKCPVNLYAGSLVPTEILQYSPKDAVIKDTASMHLDEIIDEIKIAHKNGQDVARVHSGDPALYGAIAEQMRRLNELNIEYEVVPGVSAYSAMAAAMKTELTLPNVTQTIVLTRTSVRSSGMQDSEQLTELGKTKATLCIHLSINNLKNVVKDLIPHYGEDCPVSIGYRVTWSDEKFIHATLSTIQKKVKEANITRTALIMVGHVLNHTDFEDSKLYDEDHWHVCRKEQQS